MMTANANDSAPALHLRYSASADALYVRLGEGRVAETIEVEEMVYVSDSRRNPEACPHCREATGLQGRLTPAHGAGAP